MSAAAAIPNVNVTDRLAELEAVAVKANTAIGPPKSGKVRSVPLIDQAAKVLDALSRRDRFTGPEDSVFVSVTGSPLPGYVLRTGFYDALSCAGLGAKRSGDRPIHFHDLRHSFGTLAVQAFALSDVRAFMGHADIATTMIYVHHVPRHDAADRLGALVAAASTETPAECVTTVGVCSDRCRAVVRP